MLIGTRMTNNEPSAITDLDVVARYDATDSNYVIKDSSNRISALLDKSKRLALGDELITNVADREFTTDTGFWTKGTGWSISGGKAIHTGAGGYLQRNSILTVGKIYKVSFIVDSISLSTINVHPLTFDNVVAKSDAGVYEIYGCAKSTILYIYTSAEAVIDNISIKEVLGNHITQTDATKMPIHTNRYNLLTYSEDFSNAVWNKSNGSVQSNQIMSPIGTLTADKFILNVGAGYMYQNPVGYNKFSSTAISVYLKHGGINIIRVQISTAGDFIDVNLLNGTKVASNRISTVESVNNGWYKITMKYDGLPADSSASTLLLIGVPSGSPHLSGDGVYVWGAQLEQSNFVGKYQRINAANDYDTNGFEYYAQFDGVDDNLKSLPFTLNQPTSIYSCLKQNSWTSGDYIWDGYSAATSILWQAPTSPLIQIVSGGVNIPLIIGAYANIYIMYNSASSIIKANTNEISATSINSNPSNGITVGANGNNINPSNISIKELIIKRIATDESDTIFNYFKNKHNVQY